MAARWLDTKVDELVAEVAALGMIIDPAARASLAEQLQQRVSATARQLRITEAAARRLVDQDAIRGMAQALVTQFAAERPGLEIAAAPADTVVSRELASLALAALAEALRVHLVNTADPASAVQTARQCADLFAVHGTCLYAAHAAPQVPITSAWLHRAARQIENAADVLDAGGSLAEHRHVRSYARLHMRSYADRDCKRHWGYKRCPRSGRATAQPGDHFRSRAFFLGTGSQRRTG